MSLFICTASADETITTDTIYINDMPIICYSNSQYGSYLIVSDLKKVHFDCIWDPETRTVKIVYSSDSIPFSEEKSKKQSRKYWKH